MTAYTSQTLTKLGQLCTSLWDSQSQPVVIQPGIKPGSVVMPPALQHSGAKLNKRCAWSFVVWLLRDNEPIRARTCEEYIVQWL
jgi:hypothetical protein